MLNIPIWTVNPYSNWMLFLFIGLGVVAVAAIVLIVVLIVRGGGGTGGGVDVEQFYPDNVFRIQGLSGCYAQKRKKIVGDVFIGCGKNNKYSGAWKNDKRSGQGTMDYANGDKYRGTWTNNQPNGPIKKAVQYSGEFTTISAGLYHTVGLKSDGTVVAVGWSYYGQCDVSGWKNIVLP